ncbi:YbaB/EbfC family DNA-binding protein [Actinoplanes bogorensis]|jgi:phosphoribosylanthranilate isomerase|uniref:YbaB/EbfC family DNA-binding protein n=1 Tax=Paractinoplanes bogorensis TaxID=1610840 RepID=A0ABS5YWB7_9ACTN|nr:YbaB/EbfC family nucleoid-associated protein [Actinoplanes bogorensis]MBU2667658.1 YbaB/EbfC family DNA-binding protein [Actinoplanes bogorensis]
MAREIDEAWIGEAIERHRRVEALRDDYERAVEAHQVSVHSPDDSIEVTVTASGRIAGIQIHGGLQHRQAAEFARELQATVTSAAEAASWAREKLHDEIFGKLRPLGEA